MRSVILSWLIAGVLFAGCASRDDGAISRKAIRELSAVTVSGEEVTGTAWDHYLGSTGKVDFISFSTIPRNYNPSEVLIATTLGEVLHLLDQNARLLDPDDKRTLEALVTFGVAENLGIRNPLADLSLPWSIHRNLGSGFHRFDLLEIDISRYFKPYYENELLPPGYIAFVTDTDLLIAGGRGPVALVSVTDGRHRIIPSNLESIIREQRYASDQNGLDHSGKMGVRDLYYDVSTGNLYLSYVARFDTGNDCFGLEILRAGIADDMWEPELEIRWEQFWRTDSCVENSNSHAAGGRIQKFRDGILVSVGDFNQHETGDSSLLDGERTEFGKFVRILENGSSQIFSRGHRNPQGLFVDEELVLSTEHGPKGGDELNLIVDGNDYGWPVASYGFEYHLEDNYRRPHQPAFTEPLYYFTPSIGISEITRYAGAEFPRWDGHFLIGSLRQNSLFLVQLDTESHVVRHVEEVFLKQRIRDLAIQSTGSVWILADDSKLLRISRSIFDIQKK